MVLLVTAQVSVPCPTDWSFRPSPSADPELATAFTPMVLPENVPVWVDVPVVFTMVRALPTASRKVLPPVMLMVVLPPVPLLVRVRPPPPVAIPGWLLENAFPVSTRSPAPLPLWLYWRRSPAAPVNVLDWIVACSWPAVAAVSSRMPSLPPAALLSPIVSEVNVIRLRSPAVLATRKLSSKPPLTKLLATDAEPVRLSNQTLESSNGVVPLVPFVPLMSELSSVNPATLVPRMA